MAEEKPKQEKTEEKKTEIVETKKEGKTEKNDDKKNSTKKKVEENKPKKNEAVVNGTNLPISTKHSIAICEFIRWKRVNDAISLLEEVVRMKQAVPMRGEIPHRKGKGMERGRYPINASKIFIKILKQLSANATVNGIDIDKAYIECKANRASRPLRRSGRMKFKRTHVWLKLSERQRPLSKKQKRNKNKQMILKKKN